ncbi:hypothetical protein [Cryobacterium sp. Y11]|uniref:hypothetical protein n=1 Tax=Cryobacterium sp. Y11 TaxID=2045016 RepID=UPI0011B0D488|nr:hypothetical protein [Cryobacterium sp. Y11]
MSERQSRADRFTSGPFVGGQPAASVSPVNTDQADAGSPSTQKPREFLSITTRDSRGLSAS